MKSTFIICHINNEPQIKNSIFAEKGKNIEHVFLNDENKEVEVVMRQWVKKYMYEL